MTTSDVHEDEWKQPPLEPAPEELSQGLSITFRGKTFLVQPPSARVGKQANSILGELARAEESGKDLDLERLRRKLGFADTEEYYDFDLEAKLFGPVYDEMLDYLTVDEMATASQALFIWVTTDKETAEEFLADPTGTRRGNREQRRARTRKATRK
jgi:hypothetical protein